MRLPANQIAFNRRLGANTLWLLLARVGSQALMVLFTLVIARRLGQAGLGAYAFMVSVIFAANILSTFGTDMLIIREIAIRRDLSQVMPALSFQGFISIGLILLINLSISLFTKLSLVTVQGLRIFSVALLPISLYSVASSVLRGLERMRTFMWINLTQAALQAGLAWVSISRGDSISKLAWLLLLAHSSAAIFAALLCVIEIKGLRSSLKAGGSPAMLPLSSALPIGLLAIIKAAYQKLSVLMLTGIDGPAAAGLFAAALRPVEAIQLGHIALTGALFPVMAQFHGTHTNRSPGAGQVLRISGWIGLVLGLVAAVLLSSLAGQLIPLLYGSQFIEAIPALRVLSWGLIPSSINIFLSARLLAARKERQLMSVLLTSLALLGGLNTWWIRSLGVTGACLAALVAEAFQAASFVLLARSLPGRSQTSWLVGGTKRSTAPCEQQAQDPILRSFSSGTRLNIWLGRVRK